MKLTSADTQIGVTFRIVEFEDSDILSLVQDPTKLARVTDCVNADRRQKVALVEARYDLSQKLNNDYGFKMLMETVKKDGEDVEVPAETEGKHIQRFVDALVDGTASPSGWTKPSGDAKVVENAAYAFLQTIANTCGDKTHDGKPCYILDINKAIRKPGVGLLPKYAKDAATNIINNGSQAKWAEKFTNGYTSGSGIAIDPIAFEAFDVVPPADASPADKQAILDRNIRNLARCIVEVRRQEEAKRAPEFA